MWASLLVLAAGGGAAALAGAPGPAPGPDARCLGEMGAAGTSFVERGAPVHGVRTPIEITGAVGGVVITHIGKPQRPLMDCELARALGEARRLWEPLGVIELRYSGAYQYRTRRGSATLSEHAHGFAIDVHAFVVREGGATRQISVEAAFEKGAGVWPATSVEPVEEADCVGRAATPDGKLLRTLACRLRGSGIFRIVMTPDDDEDHRNHFHLEAFPDAVSRATSLLGRKPLVEPHEPPRHVTRAAKTKHHAAPTPSVRAARAKRRR